MNNIKRSFKKGFTLVELVIVMAIFSILLVGVMALMGPVSRIFSNTSLGEKTYSYSNNIQVFLQGKLEYADNLYVFTSDTLEDYAHAQTDVAVSSSKDGVIQEDELYAIAENFRAGSGFMDGHYANLVTYDGASENFAKGKIYIMRLVNTDDGVIAPGQITLRTYDFVSNEKISSVAAHPEVPQLNDAFFNAQDAVYSFNYALGATTMVGVPTPAGASAGDSYRALANDFNNDNHGAGLSNMTISIVTDKDPDHDGYIDVDGVDAAGSAYTYRAFRNPVVLQVANLPLTNINMRAKLSSGSYGVRRMMNDGSGTILQNAEQAGDGFRIRSDPKIDFQKDIYFVFAYADELV